MLAFHRRRFGSRSCHKLTLKILSLKTKYQINDSRQTVQFLVFGLMRGL